MSKYTKQPRQNFEPFVKLITKRAQQTPELKEFWGCGSYFKGSEFCGDLDFYSISAQIDPDIFEYEKWQILSGLRKLPKCDEFPEDCDNNSLSNCAECPFFDGNLRDEFEKKIRTRLFKGIPKSVPVEFVPSTFSEAKISKLK